MGEDIEPDEVITYHELLGIYEEDSKELKKLTLKCMNCGQIGTVMGRRQEKDDSGLFSPTKYYSCESDSDSIECKQASEDVGMKEGMRECLKRTIRKQKEKEDKDKANFADPGKLHLKSKSNYKEEVKCPNCGSTAIKLTEKSFETVVAEAV